MNNIYMCPIHGIRVLILYVVNGKSLQQKAKHYMDSVCFYHLLVVIYTVCLLLNIYMSIQYCSILHTEGDGHFGGKEMLHFIV